MAAELYAQQVQPRVARSNSGGGLTPSARPFRSPLFPRRLAFSPGSIPWTSTYGLPFFFVVCAPCQAAAPYTLPAGGWIYLRWVTTALCCTGCFYTLRASGFSTPQSIPSLQSSLPRSSIGLHGKALVVKARGRPPSVQF